MAVIGAGYVGLVAGACFASFGFDVSLVEVNPKKLDSLKRGEVPIFEPGLEGLIEDSRELGRIHFYSSSKELFKEKSPDVVFIAVGTPENPDGSANLTYVMQAVKDVVSTATKDVVLVLKSTVPVGTARQVKDLVASLAPKVRVGVVNNPEFLKEGTAVSDFLRPERVLLGGTEDWALEKAKALYNSLLHQGRPLFVTDHETAELAKLSANLMLASRVSVINQVSRLATAYGADVRQIEKVLRSDSRIGSKYLFASLGYGGSCFPKDVKDFIHLCKEKNIDASVAESIHNFNEGQKLFFMNDLKATFPKGSKVAVLGIAFKPETDDIREAPALKITEELARAGYVIRAYDPKATEPFHEWIKQKELSNISTFETAAEALENADCLILATEWQEFQRLALGSLPRYFRGKKVYDGKNLFNPQQVRNWGFEYMGIGRA